MSSASRDRRARSPLSRGRRAKIMQSVTASCVAGLLWPRQRGAGTEQASSQHGGQRLQVIPHSERASGIPSVGNRSQRISWNFTVSLN
ncbi:hypothetical protein SKAU_G00144380 [Synaphobranchus kaupii]|uniref:Uncharacterized protein n=1 Tax=Synaphobranchus kaupii TaxID=118154 RepID=A0A9Q1FTX0_SYNKA|nr:hypothetical protein SKAU_G00144380 [Synaphobranchus kaupii]